MLTSMCSSNPDSHRIWRVRNPNNEAISYHWDVYGTDQAGFGYASAGDSFFSTNTIDGANTTRLFVDNVQQQVKAGNPASCEAPQ